MQTALKQITTRAKQLRRKHKLMTWKTAIRTASKEYNSGKKIGRAPVKKAKTVKRKNPPTKKHKDTNNHNVRVNVVSGPIKKEKILAEIKDKLYYIASIENYLRDESFNIKQKNISPRERLISKGGIRLNKKLLIHYKKQLRELKKLL